MVDALARLRKLPVAVAAFKRTLKLELFYLAQVAMEEATHRCEAQARARPHEVARGAPDRCGNQLRCRCARTRANEPRGPLHGDGVDAGADGITTLTPTGGDDEWSRVVLGQFPYKSHMTGARTVAGPGQSGACWLTITQWRPPRHRGLRAEWSRLSSRHAQAKLFQTLLTALYGRYARSFRRIQFALERIARQMPPAPPGYVRRRGAWGVVRRGHC